MCASGYVWAYNSTTLCVSDCGDGYLKDTTQGKCIVCDSNCHTCANIITNCTSCGTLSGNQTYLTSSFSCVITCPISYFMKPSLYEYRCDTCHANCSSCMDI